ncbi:hypothetical protein PHYSODRAFT_326994 [Phytophthora sojae]|uniref:Uncharacterized protein n=1 Tax=Phytophthora sojae (strain P6497) TaxID=1094619 RepID=G4YVM8_PHYSP|nr:hypothetical protein PHYSODRAFT_326994 [Phytophthora sojae]EGZ26060.1 hypothetical protein PHYSODRAFT_326994 [Phytophthora sojae]|eukprot:XP_009521348.1 hypothetical protein PHYSODRAFT_326994 [Phytophthora sojae]
MLRTSKLNALASEMAKLRDCAPRDDKDKGGSTKHQRPDQEEDDDHHGQDSSSDEEDEVFDRKSMQEEAKVDNRTLERL